MVSRRSGFSGESPLEKSFTYNFFTPLLSKWICEKAHGMKLRQMRWISVLDRPVRKRAAGSEKSVQSWPSGQPGTKEKHGESQIHVPSLGRKLLSKKDTSLPEILCRSFGALSINELKLTIFSI